MQSEEEKEFAQMKREALKQVLKNQYTFENYKYVMAGSFWGLITGIVAGFTLPQEKIANNKWIRKHLNTAAEYPAEIFREVTFSTFTMLGTIIGGCIELVRTHKRIASRHAAEAQRQAMPLPEAEPASADNIDNMTTDIRMQERVASRRQEVIGQRIR